VNNSGSTRTIRFFRADVNYFRERYPTTLAQQYDHNRGVTNCDDAYPLVFTDLESSKI